MPHTFLNDTDSARSKARRELTNASKTVEEMLGTPEMIVEGLVQNIENVSYRLRGVFTDNAYTFDHLRPVVSGYSSPVEEMFVRLVGKSLELDLESRMLRIEGGKTPSIYDCPINSEIAPDAEVLSMFQNPEDILVFIDSYMNIGYKAIMTLRFLDRIGGLIKFRNVYFVPMTTAGQRAFMNPLYSYIVPDDWGEYDGRILRGDNTDLVDSSEGWLNTPDTRTDEQKNACEFIKELTFLVSARECYRETGTIRLGMSSVVCHGDLPIGQVTEYLNFLENSLREKFYTSPLSLQLPSVPTHKFH